MAKGWRKVSGKWYYLEPETGKMAIWSRTIDGKDYYFDASGAMHTGWLQWNNDRSWSYFDASGAMATGWRKVDGIWYYLDPATKRAVTGERQIDGAWYYFNKSCKMQTGWVDWGNKTWSYYNGSGVRASGTQKIGTQTFAFDADGRTKTEPILLPEHQRKMNAKAQGFSSDTSWLILVDRSSKHVGIYRGSKGDWTNVKYWSCGVGKPSSPTISGSYKVSGKGLSFGHGYTCWYYTQIKGNYLFHSVTYKQGSKTQILDGRLGIANSAGCVRLDIKNAKWMYDNVPYNTKIFIY